MVKGHAPKTLAAALLRLEQAERDRDRWKAKYKAEVGSLRAEVAALRAKRQRVVLTVEEIADLARVTGDSEPDERYVIEPANPEGILDQDTGVTTRHRFCAYLEEYPEEGAWPLGPPLEDQGRE